MDAIYASGTCSSSHTYGNVASLVKEAIKSYFPYNFFKYIRISTELLSNEMKEERLNSDTEMVKVQYPRLIINPSFNDLREEDKFLGGTYLTNGSTKFNSHVDRRWLMDFITDRKNNVKLQYMMNRDRLIFDVTIVVDTLFNQIDIYKNIYNLMNWDSPFYINTSLESMIPRSMIDYISRLNGIDLDKDPGVLLDYLNNNASYPVTYKMRNSTSRDEYFLYYDIRLLTTFSDLEISEANKKNQADTSFTINFKTTIDFNLPAAYYLIGDAELKLDGISVSAAIEDVYQSELVPIFTVYDLFRGIHGSNENFKLYKTSIFKTEKENDGLHDKLCFANIIGSEELLEVIKNHISLSIPIETFLEVVIIKDKDVIKDWSVDWNSMTVTINNADSSATYRIVLLINTLYANERIVDILKERSLDKEFNPKLTLDN